MRAAATSIDDSIASLHSEAKRDAEAVRRAVWRDHWFPVDPVRIARALGLKVLDARLPDDVAGAIVRENGRDPIVVSNATDHRSRKRFILAHQLGHVVRRTDDGAFEHVDRRDTLAATGTDPEEIYANVFAANLLMPEYEVRRLRRGKRASDLDLALRFGVPREAARRRLADLGIDPR